MFKEFDEFFISDFMNCRKSEKSNQWILQFSGYFYFFHIVCFLFHLKDFMFGEYFNCCRLRTYTRTINTIQFYFSILDNS